MDIEIPDSFDAEWQCEMLRNLLVKLNDLMMAVMLSAMVIHCLMMQ